MGGTLVFFISAHRDLERLWRCGDGCRGLHQAEVESFTVREERDGTVTLRVESLRMLIHILYGRLRTYVERMIRQGFDLIVGLGAVARVS
jgi:hypothetical protein